MIKLSVIIPNYNKDAYIGTLLTHLKEQLTDEVEVIVIDDASTDTSRSIIDGFSEDFIIICNKTNKYNSYTRNKGIEIAKGKYITFIDSDDDIVPTFVSTILENIKSNHDGYFFDYTVKNVFNGKPVEKGYNAMVWSKVYKRKVLKDNKILFNVEKFPKGVLGEDSDFNLEFIRATKDIIKVDTPIIIYNWGVSHSVSNDEQVKEVEPVYEVDAEFMNKWF